MRWRRSPSSAASLTKYFREVFSGCLIRELFVCFHVKWIIRVVEILVYGLIIKFGLSQVRGSWD
jgi:hypothetical protein